MKKRQFIRHPSDMPIEVHQVETRMMPAKKDRMRDISFGGLSIQSDEPMKKGMVLEVGVPLVDPQFGIKARVAWCHCRDGAYDVGLEFVDADKLFKARMVEQVCQIEHYRHEMRRTEGRELTHSEAAIEWISKYAADFPGI